jgi:hypothetical protein
MRRMFRRQIRKTLAQEVPPVLQEANFTFDKGEYGRAAQLYERLAQAADARGGPRAPIFHLQAGRSRIYAGQTALGMSSLKRGLELFTQRGQLQKLQNMGSRIVVELKERGLTRESAEIEALLNGVSPSMPAVARGSAPGRKPILPTHCPSCGAALKPDEVEWLDEVTAECGYCGSPIREEK